MEQTAQQQLSPPRLREPVRPESFTGTYTPVYAGDALKYFFNVRPEGFGPLDPEQALATGQPGAALADSIPIVEQGYLLRNTCPMLFYIYAHTNQLEDRQNPQFTRSDDVMMAAFGGDIPAAFYKYRGTDGKLHKIRMDQAIQQGLITAPMNTYDVIRQSHPTFNPQRFETYYFQKFAAANYYSRVALGADPALEPIAQALEREDIRAAMLQEHNIVKAARTGWHNILEPVRRQQRDIRKRTVETIRRTQRDEQQDRLDHQNWLQQWQNELLASGINPGSVQQPDINYLRTRYGPVGQ